MTFTATQRSSVLVARQVHRGHPAAAQLRFEPVAPREYGADQAACKPGCRFVRHSISIFDTHPKPPPIAAFAARQCPLTSATTPIRPARCPGATSPSFGGSCGSSVIGLRFSWVMGGLARSYGPDYRDTESGVGAGTNLLRRPDGAVAGNGRGFGDAGRRPALEHEPDRVHLSGVPGGQGGRGAGPGRGVPVPPQAARGAHDRAQEARSHGGARRRGGTRRPERRPIPHRPRVERDHRGVRGRSRRRSRSVRRRRGRQGRVSETEGRERISFPSARLPRRGRRTTTASWDRSPTRPTATRRSRRARSRCAPSRPSRWRRSACFGRCATRELEELTGRPRPVLEADLWALARDWRLRPVGVLGGTFWELA